MDRLGLGYAQLRQINPGLIYCAITGYGQSGPYRERPGYDTVIQAQGGLMSITGPTQDGADGEPFKVGVAIVDVSAGLFAVTSILAALHHRGRTGQGQYIDIALFDAQLGWLANVAGAYLLSGQPPRRYGNAHGTIVPYQTFPSADGHLMLAVGNDGQFARFCKAAGHPEWAADERFATNTLRVRHREALIPLMETATRTRTTADWVALLEDKAVPCGPINDIGQGFADPQVQARGLAVRQPCSPAAQAQTAVGSIATVASPLRLQATPPVLRRAPPALGEHTDEVLAELGLDAAGIAALRQAGVV